MTTKALFLTVLLAVPVLAQADMYRWTDADGHVHFSDKPVDQSGKQEVDAEQIHVQGPAALGQGDAVQQINDRVKRLHKAEAEERQIEQAAKAKKKKAAADLALRCRHARAELRKYNGPVYREDDDGNRVYLTEEEHANGKAKVQAWIASHCTE